MVAFLYHGVWNLGEEAKLFWLSSKVPYPEWMRWPVGVGECVFALGLISKRTEKLASLGLMLLMVGAVISNFSNGYSYKHLGIEVPIAYLTMLYFIYQSSNKATMSG